MRRILFLVLSLGATSALDQARDAFVKGQYQLAIQLAEPHLHDEPDQAWRVIGGCYCFLKDKPGALKAWSSLDEKGQSFLKYVCSRNGIALP
jgi:hypothetical protein